MHLGWYLFNQCPEMVRNKNILELGAGTGFLSVLCAGHLKAASVLATDGLSHVCESLQANINLNVHNNTLQGNSVPEILQLDWDDHRALDKLIKDVKDAGKRYDLILGADVTYNPVILHPLAEVLSILKDNFPNVIILISATVRSETFSQFTEICENEFKFKVTKQQVGIPDGLRYSGFFHTVATPIKVISLER